MTCDEARELIGAEPGQVSPDLQAHLDSCPTCRDWLSDMQKLDARIRQALLIDPAHLRTAGVERAPPGLPLTPSGLQPPSIRRHRAWTRRLSIVTSLAAGVLVAFSLWVSRPSASLASEVVTHVEGEPASWSRTEPVSQQHLGEVLTSTRVALGPGMGPIVYASSCRFRGHLVPHLVVSTPSGPVTVMILEHERVRSPQNFQEDGFSGLLVPARSGSVAILSRTPMALQPPAAAVLRALDAANNTRAPSTP